MKNKTKTRWTLAIILTILLVQNFPAAAGTTRRPADAFTITIQNAPPAVAEKVQNALPLSVGLVDRAIEVLSAGWDEMNSDERALFSRFFDPGNTGEIDPAFVQAAVDNYRKIRQEFDAGLALKFEADSQTCQGMGLFYTDFIRVHACPYLLEETRSLRIARDLVHELAHMAFIAWDRAYYHETSTSYARLTPRGPWAAQLPVVGPLFRELTRQDTLYHPDAYSHFAAHLFSLESDSVQQPDSRQHEHDGVHAPSSSEVQAVDSKLFNSIRITSEEK